jgi:hypothetical protein
MEEDKFKKLIHSIGPDEPGAGFTDHIMKMIEIREELSLNPALQSVLKKELFTEPSVEFSDNLMANIQPKANKIVKPIITKKTWLIISGVAFLILLLILIISHSNSDHLPVNSHFSRSALNISGTVTGIMKISYAVLTYLIPFSILIFMDYIFRTRQSR